MNCIFVIQKAVVDNWENDARSAYWYEVFSFTETEEEAIDFCSNGGVLTKKDCWAILKSIPKYRYFKLEKHK